MPPWHRTPGGSGTPAAAAQRRGRRPGPVGTNLATGPSPVDITHADGWQPGPCLNLTRGTAARQPRSYERVRPASGRREPAAGWTPHGMTLWSLLAADSLLALDWAWRPPRSASPRGNGGRLSRGTGLAAAASPHRPGAGTRRAAQSGPRIHEVPGGSPDQSGSRPHGFLADRSEPRRRRSVRVSGQLGPGRGATPQSASADATPLGSAVSHAGTGPVGSQSLSLDLRPGRS